MKRVILLLGDIMTLLTQKQRLILFLMVTTSALFAGQVGRKYQVIVKTVPEAVAHIDKIIEKFPKDAAQFLPYEKEQAEVMIRCAKVLYDNAREQILYALSEIDTRIAYWQYQKDHPWNYFISKNPLKWITGPAQEDEIEDNLEALYSHQGHLYAILGQLAEQGAIFTQGYKDIFLIDYKKGYEWVDGLLSVLHSIAIKQQASSAVPFIARAQQLHAKLDNVLYYKDGLLSDISNTEIPSYVEQNWLKSGALLLGLGYGYNKFTLAQLQAPFLSVSAGLQGNVIAPVQEIMKDVFAGRAQEAKADLLVSPENVNTVYNSVKNFLDTLSSPYPALDYISPERKQAILDEIKEGGNTQFQALSSELSQYWLGKAKWVEAKALLLELAGVQSAVRGQKELESLRKQFVGVGKIAFLTPALLLAFASYTGYKKFTKKNYAPLRRALVEVNSLFVDPSKPLTDEQYGKMIYLIYNLKNQAKKQLPVKWNVQASFIKDLERIESQEFSVAAKRAIIKDMFRKYEFLGLIQKK